ncbi:AMSH-like protease sst2 [Yarrowia sp. B02]|nr:AMSH-like protease sst2 [Yarrowia sp. B02]
MLSIAEIAAKGLDYPYTNNTSFRVWIHVVGTVLREAEIYRDDGDFEKAYLLYTRFADLLLNKMPTHPGLKANRALFKKMTAKMPGVLQEMQQLKKALEVQIAEEKKAEEERQRKLRALQKASEKERSSGTSSRIDDLRSQLGRGGPDHVNLEEYSFGRYEPRREPGPSYEHGNYQQTQQQDTFDYPDLNRELSSVLSPYVYESGPITLSPTAGDIRLADSPPAVPAMPSALQATQQKPAAPAPPATASSSVEHTSRYTTEGGLALRSLFIPAELEAAFLKVAHANTVKNLETCGILCGKLSRNAFFVTHLMIPPQESTSDTCQTTNEELLFEQIDENDLFVLGWIHTHPTQTCFMSSVDLHTQNSYQIMLPEAVALVCAPQHDPNFGIFRLSDPPGVDIIKNCNRGGFHPHTEDNIYNNARHAMVKSGLPFSMKDLRS